jgi:hypothetical protein
MASSRKTPLAVFAPPLPAGATVVFEAVERRVTIYAGGLVWIREQATWFRVFRAPDAQYADAFHIDFKPRGKQRLRRRIESYKPRAIIVAGWHHPDTSPRILQRNLDEPTLAPSLNSVTVGGPPETDMNLIVDRYIRSLPATEVLLDLRGLVVATGRKWS